MTGGMFLNLMGVQNLASAFRHVQSGLQAAPDEISWIITSFIIAEVVMLPLSGWLLRAMSVRWFFVMCAGGFTAASVLCALSWDIGSAIAFRGIQGFFGGGMMPAVFAVMFTHYPREQRDRVSMVVGLFATAASAIGPLMGGVIAETVSWRWIFLANVPIGIAVTLAGALLGRFDTPETGLWRRIDFPGVLLAVLALGPGLVVLEEGRREDWFDSTLVTVLFAVSATAFVLFLVRELTCRNPVVDLRVFRTRNFALGSVIVFAWAIVLFAPAYLLPVFIARVRELDGITIGQMVFVLGTGQFLSGFIALALFQIWPRRVVALVGFLMMGVGTLMQGSMFAGLGFWDTLPAQAVRGLSAQLCFLPILNLALGYLGPDRIKNATGLFNLMMRLGAAVGIGTMNSVLEARIGHHYVHLSEAALRGAREVEHDWFRPLARGLEPVLSDSFPAVRGAFAYVYRVAEREALVLAFNECMFALGVFLLVLAPGTMLLRGLSFRRGNPRGPAPAAETDQAIPSQALRMRAHASSSASSEVA